MMGRFLNTAHRSTYWTQHLTALAASTANAVPLEGRIFPSYPSYLRRRGPTGRNSIVEKLAEVCGTNQSTTREEFLQPLMALMQDDHALGDSSDFGLSLAFGLSSDEHLSLTGLAKTRRSSKALAKAYDEAEEAHREARLQRQEETDNASSKSVQPPKLEKMQEPARQDVIEQPEDKDDQGPAPGQMTLF